MFVAHFELVSYSCDLICTSRNFRLTFVVCRDVILLTLHFFLKTSYWLCFCCVFLHEICSPKFWFRVSFLTSQSSLIVFVKGLRTWQFAFWNSWAPLLLLSFRPCLSFVSIVPFSLWGHLCMGVWWVTFKSSWKQDCFSFSALPADPFNWLAHYWSRQNPSYFQLLFPNYPAMISSEYLLFCGSYLFLGPSGALWLFSVFSCTGVDNVQFMFLTHLFWRICVSTLSASFVVSVFVHWFLALLSCYFCYMVFWGDEKLALLPPLRITLFRKTSKVRSC